MSKKNNKNNNNDNNMTTNNSQKAASSSKKNRLHIRSVSAQAAEKMPDINFKDGIKYLEANQVCNLFDLIYGDTHVDQEARGDFDSYYIRDKRVYVDKDFVLKMICLSPEFGISFVKALFIITENKAFANMVDQIKAGKEIAAPELMYVIPMSAFYSCSDTVRRLTESQLQEQFPQRGILGYANLLNLYNLMSIVASKNVNVAGLSDSYKDNYKKIRLEMFKDVFNNDIPKLIFTRPMEVKVEAKKSFIEQYLAPNDLTYEMGLIFGIKNEEQQEHEQEKNEQESKS